MSNKSKIILRYFASHKDILWFDQKEGIIYCFDENDGVDVVFDATITEDELEFKIAYPEPIWNGGDQRIR